MEKAKLMVRETKKHKIVAELRFLESGKTMPFPQAKLKDASKNDTEVDVERDKGKIVLVKAGDEIIYENRPAAPAPGPRQAPAPGGQWRKKVYDKQAPRAIQSVSTETRMQTEHLKRVRNRARAPYNFAPLNEKVVEVDWKILPEEINKYFDKRRTGAIEIEMETITPLYIRGALNREQVKDGVESKNVPGFFSPGGRVRIPGSSTRGMVRSLVEIVSFGKFENFDDRRLYFRGLADKSNVRMEYQKMMSSYDRRQKKAIYKVSAGVLRQNGMDYEIVSCGSDYEPILKKNARTRVEKRGNKYEEFRFYKLHKEYLVVSGDMPNKKRDWLISFPKENARVIPISREDARNYNDDVTRAEGSPNLLHLAKKRKKPVPCFYVLWHDQYGNERVSFGFTAMFRLAYTKTVGEHVPLPGYRITAGVLKAMKEKKHPAKALGLIENLVDKQFNRKELRKILDEQGLKNEVIESIMARAAIIDIPEAIFGNEKTFAGRVFFEDAYVDGNPGDIFMGEGTPKILSTPKPTTFQHYLVQKSDNIRQLNHYNSPASIRGYKLYWHKSGDNWKETDPAAIKEHHTQYTRINPVRPNVKFKGLIRFENLTDIELGALLFALDLPDGCRHKLGMGKPLGLGSIKVTPSRLLLSNRVERYTELFADLAPGASDEIPELKQAFETHILKEIGEKGKKSLWEVDRLQELKTLLDLKTGVNRERMNRYMNITPRNEFKNRPVLPLPKDAGY